MEKKYREKTDYQAILIDLKNEFNRKKESYENSINSMNINKEGLINNIDKLNYEIQCT